MAATTPILLQPDHAARGIACATKIDQFAEVFRGRKDTEGISLGVTPIGVHTGPAIVGNFGREQFFD